MELVSHDAGASGHAPGAVDLAHHHHQLYHQQQQAAVALQRSFQPMGPVEWDAAARMQAQVAPVPMPMDRGCAGVSGAMPIEAEASGSALGKSLSLSYQGDQWVFDAVHPEKFHSIMRILAGPRTPGGSERWNGKHSLDLPSRMPQSQRLRSLARFREKRKERRYDKRIRYTVRKEVAQKMHRNKGQFASARSSEAGVENGTMEGEEGFQVPGAARTCKHCGAAEGSTPMMRRGPDGPRTLCNACGLMWANKKKLRDLSKASSCRGGSTAGRGRAALAVAQAQMMSPTAQYTVTAVAPVGETSTSQDPQVQ